MLSLLSLSRDVIGSSWREERSRSQILGDLDQNWRLIKLPVNVWRVRPTFRLIKLSRATDECSVHTTKHRIVNKTTAEIYLFLFDRNQAFSIQFARPLLNGCF